MLHLIWTEGPKATVYVCTSCTVVLLSTTSVNFLNNEKILNFFLQKKKQQKKTRNLKKTTRSFDAPDAPNTLEF